MKPRRRLPTTRRRRPARAPRPVRPPDLEAIRQRQQLLEVELDTAELIRRRAAIEADMAAAMAPAPRAPEPERPLPTSPFLSLQVRRVVTATSLAVLVEVGAYHLWVPKSAISYADPDSLLAGWSGPLEISSWWARSVGISTTNTRSAAT